MLFFRLMLGSMMYSRTPEPSAPNGGGAPEPSQDTVQGSSPEVSAIDADQTVSIGQQTVSGSQIRDALRDARLARRFQGRADALEQENKRLAQEMAEIRQQLNDRERQSVLEGLQGINRRAPSYESVYPASVESSEPLEDTQPWEIQDGANPNAPGTRAGTSPDMSRQAMESLVNRVYAGTPPQQLEALIEQKVQQRLAEERQREIQQQQLSQVHQQIVQGMVDATGVSADSVNKALDAVKAALGAYDQITEAADDGEAFERYGEALKAFLQLSPELGKAFSEAEQVRRREELESQVLQTGPSPSSSQQPPADTDTMSDAEYEQHIRSQAARERELRRQLS